MLSIRGLSKMLAALGCCVLVLAPGVVLGDEDEEYMRDRGSRTFFRDPARGYPGVVIEVSGTGCSEGEFPFERPYDKAAVSLVHATRGSEEFILTRQYPINRDGTWHGEFGVPASTPPGPYELQAGCWADDMLFISGEASFRVLSRDPPATPVVVDPSPTRASVRPLPPAEEAAPGVEVEVEASPSVEVVASPPPPSPVLRAVEREPAIRRSSSSQSRAVQVGAIVALVVAMVAVVVRRLRAVVRR